jgi:RNA polymerase sigma-32 factor
MTAWSSETRGLDVLKHQAASVAPLPRDEEVALLCRAHAGDAAAVDILVKAHVRFVFAIADQFRQYGVSFDELVSEGLVGLMEAVRRFDPQRGTRLASYAAWWIRALIRRYTLDNRRIVRAPGSRSSRKLIAHLGSTRRALAQQLGAEPDNELGADELGVTVEDIQEVDGLLRRRDSVANGHETDDYVAACPAASPEAQLIERESKRDVRAAVARGLALLSARERSIMAQRALGDEPRKLSDLGVELGVSRERVRQLERQSFAKLRGELCSAIG